MASGCGEVPRLYQHQLRRAPCSSWRAPRRRCCPGARAATSTMRMSVETICYAILAAFWATHSRPGLRGAATLPERIVTTPSLVTVQPLLNIAVRAARRAGEVIIRSLNRLESLKVTSKGRNDFVTEVDHAGGSRDHRHHQPPLPEPCLPRGGERRERGAATRCGSSTRWMGRPTSCTVSRCSRSQSPARSRAAWSTRWCTTPCAGRSSAPRAAAARTWTTAVSA